MTSSPEPKNKRKAEARAKLLEAALSVIRTKGYSATSVDDLCRAAGVTKGAFFHHFKTKDDLAVAAADYWSQTTGALFEGAAFHDLDDPLDRLLGYLAFRRALIAGAVPEFTCLVGTMTQEVFDTSPAIRDACADGIYGHADTLVADIAKAAEHHDVALPCSAESLAIHTQAVIQGGFILAKARNDPQQAVDSIDHLTRYVRFLFNLPV